MENIEDIKNFKLYTYSVERWSNNESNDDKNYLQICIKQFLFDDDEVLEYFEEHLNEIKGKTNKEFTEWLEEKADEEGSDLEDFLEMEAGVYLEFIEESLFEEETEKEISDSAKLFEAGDFELTNSQPYIEDTYFNSIDEVKKEILDEYPYFK
tara:strand:- start:106 stop:564 length:459 start_codon:yes stop_codon:yes gene_type:complete